MNTTFSTGLALWAPTVPMDESGAPLRAAAGPHERSFTRLAATLLARAERRAHAIVPTTKLASGGHAWVLAGRAWTPEEAFDAPEITGDANIAFGSCDFRGHFILNYAVVNRAERKLVWSDEFKADDFLSLLLSFLRGVDTTFLPSRPSVKNELWLSHLPTRDPKALWHLLEAIDVREALELKIAISDPAAAFESITNAMEADPNCNMAAGICMAVAIRWIVEKHGNAQFAFDALDRAAKLLPSLGRIEAARAESYLSLENYNLALEAGRRFAARAVEADRAYAEELIGRVYDKMDEPSKAAAAFGRAVAIDPRRAQSWVQLGYMAAKLNKWEEAELCYARAVEAAPENKDIEQKLQIARKEVLKIREKRGPLRPGSQ